MEIKLNALKIENDTVTYSWRQDSTNPFLFENQFYIQYPGISLQQVDRVVLWNAFLGLMIPVFQLFDTPVKIIFPDKIPPDLVRFWLTFNDAFLIKILTPSLSTKSRRIFRTLSCPIQAPWIQRITKCKVDDESPDEDNKRRPQKAAILFGGGKDSTFSLGVLSEMLGASNVEMLGYINLAAQTKNYAELLSEFESRRLTQAIEPIRQTEANPYYHIRTNFSANCRNKSASHATHIALYTSTCLPYIIERKIDLLVFNYELCHFYTHRIDGKVRSPTFFYRKARPEYLAATKSIYRKVFSIDLDISNFSYPISELTTFQTICKRYPALQKTMLMCTATTNSDERWCYRCKKCYEYAIFSLHFKSIDTRFDYDRFFLTSDYIKTVLGLIDTSDSPKWHPKLVFEGHFQSYCHVLYMLDMNYLRESLSHASISIIEKIQNKFSKEYPVTEAIATRGLASIPAALRTDYLKTLERIANPQRDLGMYRYGNKIVQFDFDLAIRLDPLSSELTAAIRRDAIDTTKMYARRLIKKLTNRFLGQGGLQK